MRIRKRILLLKKTGRQYKSSSFKLYLLPSDEYKIGFISGSKIGNASSRNYTKRLIRDFWMREFKKGDFLFILYKIVPRDRRDDFLKELEKIAREIKCENLL